MNRATIVFFAAVAAAPSLAWGQSAGTSLPSISLGPIVARPAVMAGAQVLLQSNAFWNFSEVFAPTAGFDPDPVWSEYYIKPELGLEAQTKSVRLKANLSVVASQTVGRDVFAQKGRGRLTLEDASVTLGAGDAEKGVAFDVTVGAQPYRIGTGMLVSDGGVDGFERGALIFGPRQAWGKAAVARVASGPISVEAFHLNPRELASSDTRTLIDGAKAEARLGADRYLGVAYGHVPRSTSPYVQAAPGGVGAPAIIFNGRDGLSFVQAYVKVSPLPARLPGLWVSGDLAWEWNDRIDMRARAGRIEVGHIFLQSPWRPSLTLGYQAFSGDNPRTARLERFDPLFYDGSPSGWATGTNGSFVFINSNVASYKAALAFNPTAQDIVTLRYASVSADRKNSPIQFGQATRPSLQPGAPGLVAGVARSKLSDDVLVEYTRILTPNAFLSFGVAHSWLGRGLDDAAFGRGADWTGAFTNLVVRY